MYDNKQNYLDYFKKIIFLKPEVKIGFMKLVNAIFNKYLKVFSLQFTKYFLKSWLFFEYANKIKNIIFLFFTIYCFVNSNIKYINNIDITIYY